MDGSYFADLERYLADQFPARDLFRGIKAEGSYRLLGLKDNNGYYVSDGSIGRLEYPLEEKSVERAAELYKEAAKFFEGADIYYTIIPDKNYVLARDKGYPAMDYERMEELMEERLAKMAYLPLFDCFSAEDYYRTDLHLKQEAFVEAADRLLLGMGNSYRASSETYEIREIPDFYGTYYGQAAVSLPSDTIRYLTSPVTERAVVYDFEAEKEIPVYLPEKAEGPDKYDIFLAGARALLVMEDRKAETDRELILVRDSFGSSLAPLLLGGYRKITLVDLRYLSSSLLGEYVKAGENCDVLFAYNAVVLNNSNMLK